MVVLDNLHNAMPHLSDVEDQTSGEAMVATRNAQGTVGIFIYVLISTSEVHNITQSAAVAHIPLTTHPFS